MDNRPITQDERLARLHDPALESPEKVMLECGHYVWNKPGQIIFNYYDCVVSMIQRTCVRPSLTNSRKMPNGVTYWITNVDCTRACCVNCAVEHGYMNTELIETFTKNNSRRVPRGEV